jgi:hypothetical protein
MLLPLKLYLLPERDTASAPPANPPAWELGGGRSITDQLETLAALRSTGALTQDEFDMAKALVLAG